MSHLKALPRKFYSRDPQVVAKELLGKRLIRRVSGNLLGGIIVEAEAYYGLDDPASRAYHGLKSHNSPMWGEPGRAFIYNVHKYWMFNVVAHEPDQIGAVLVRSIEPTEGVDAMRKNRGVEEIRLLTNGPGKLSQALEIDRRVNEVRVYSCRSKVFVMDSEMKFEVGTSYRIGVRRDLEKKLRFYINGNRFVSKMSKALD